MKKNNIVKTIETLLSEKEMKWVRLAHYQSWNAEQTNRSDYSIRYMDETLSQNETECNPYEFLNREELQMILGHINDLKFAPNKFDISVYVDTFGDRAGVPRVSFSWDLDIILR